MIGEKILELRKKLNEAIANGQPYDEIYKISVELDEAIWKYYERREVFEDSTELVTKGCEIGSSRNKRREV